LSPARPGDVAWVYWAAYIIWPILGGVVAYIYTLMNFEMNALFAFQTGLAAPLVIRSLLNAVPKHPINPGPGAWFSREENWGANLNSEKLYAPAWF
jgi:hypothetical protein